MKYIVIKAHCTSPPDCQNEGYVNVECTCTCPVGFTGTNCDTIITDPGQSCSS